MNQRVKIEKISEINSLGGVLQYRTRRAPETGEISIGSFQR